ncbi:MAG: tetratricopeptide repeat protein [Synechococcus sp.]
MGRVQQSWCTALLVAATTLTGSLPAKALVPTVYVPKATELEQSAIDIGRSAAQLLSLGQLEDAARLAALAVRLQPNDERLWAVLAEAQLRSKQLEPAAESLARAKELDPNNARFWFAEASLALRNNRPSDAIPLLDRGLELEPGNAAAYFDLGNARVMQTQYTAALNAFKKAFALQPTFWEALNNQGIVLFEMDNISDAIKRWRQVLRIERNAEPMLALAAALNRETPGSDEALRLARQALEQDPNYVLPQHQTEQLWGLNLRLATRDLLTDLRLQDAVERAEANADPSSTP